MLSKRQFCNVINALKSNSDLTDELNEAFRKYQTDIEISGSRIEDVFINTLQIIFNDRGEWISYWCYDLKFGEYYKEGDVLDENGEIIPLQTSEELYEFLIDNYYDSMSDANGDFETIMSCAARYALGRRTYIPGLVINYITPMIHNLSEKTLACLIRDIEQAEKDNMLGDESIDKPLWLCFLQNLKKERSNRE